MTYRHMLDRLLKINITNFDKCPEFDLTESITATNISLEKNPKCYRPLIEYIAGNCQYNAKISHNEPISDTEQIKTNLLDELILATKPVAKPLYLFHGFEPGIKYDDHKWQIGSNIKFNFHLSKTPAIWVASRFTNHFNCYMNTNSFQHLFIFNYPYIEYPQWYIHEKTNTDHFSYKLNFYDAFASIFIQKYLFCVYSEANRWHHVSTDIRCPAELLNIASYKKQQSLLANEEFEYLSHKNEEFKLVDIVYKFSFSLPLVRKFYVMERIESNE